MKFQIITYIFFFLSSHIVFSQVGSHYSTKGNVRDTIKSMTKDFRTEKSRTMPSFEVQSMLIEDEELEKSNEPRPYRFGKGFDTNIYVSLEDDGDETKEGRTWAMEFYSKGALSINFVLEKLNLSDGAELYLYNSDNTMIYGPVTSENNKKGIFLTDLVQGDRITMYVHEPIDVKQSSTFSIKRVVHAYRGIDLGAEMNGGNPGASESCNNDVACFYPLWQNPARTVGLIILPNGSSACTGCLLNTTDNSFRPYFLTAFHCADSNQDDVLSNAERNNAEDWMYKFGFRRAGCSTSNGYYNWSTVNGGDFRAGWGNTDFFLIEIDNFGDRNSFAGSAMYAGWDRRANNPISGSSIHHPAGDMQKISAETDVFQVSSWNGVNNMWEVNFDDGVVQHGSSGAPIFNQDLRVVGQLHGNQNYNPWLDYCDQPRAEYGRFNLSWTGGGTNNTRLSNWLDPCGTGALTTNTINGLRMSTWSSVGCSPRNYNIWHVPAGSTVSWTSSSNLQRLSAQGAIPASYKAIGSGSAWVRATVTPANGCGNSYYVQTLTTATATSTNISLSASNSNGYVYGYANGGSSPYNWTIYGSNGSNQVTTTSPSLSYYVGCGGGYLQVQSTNSCGDPAYGSISIPSCSGSGIYYMTVYPNPSSNEITVQRNSEYENFNSSEASFDESVTLTLYDFSASKVKSKIYKEKSEKLKLGISDLKKGNYYLKIIGKGIDETHQVVVD